MGEKKQLNVRIPLELQEKIENDGRPKVEIVIEALELYFASKAKQDDSNNDISANNSAAKMIAILAKSSKRIATKY
jgi:hypothetical protein